MDIIGSILRILKSINLRYEKDCDDHSINLNLNDEPTNITGSLSMKVSKHKKSEISAKLGKDEDT